MTTFQLIQAFADYLHFRNNVFEQFGPLIFLKVEDMETINQDQIDHYYNYISPLFENVLESYVEGVYQKENLTESTFEIILDYIGFQLWKNLKNLPSKLDTVNQIQNYICKPSMADRWDHIVLSHHPIAFSSIKRYQDIVCPKRVMDRCRLIKEELMMNRWHPSRVEHLLMLGFDVEDM